METANLLLALTLSPCSKVIAKGKKRVAARLDSGEFRCRTCGRRFATFQALGGHRTSHGRPLVRADGLELVLAARPGKGRAVRLVHRCRTCGMVFATGQALGGHMRRHRPAAHSLDVSETASGVEEHEESTLALFI